MQLSKLPYLEHIATFYGAIFVGFGILWFVNPTKAISFFELPYPEPKKSRATKKTDDYDAKKAMDLIAIVYGIRDIFMGAAIHSAALFGTRDALGWIMIAAGCVAMTDGVACKVVVGKGEWNHWSYGPVLLMLGAVTAGAMDWVPLDDLLEKIQ